jgi:outer membrane protein assembly factor BamB
MNTRSKFLLLLAAVVVVVAGAATYVTLLPSSPGSSSSAPSGPAICSSSAEGPASANWTTYHQNPTRDGVQATAKIASVHSAWSGPTTVDGQVYAEPLVCGNSVFVATEDDSVYAINATTGATVWQTHLGTPMPSGSLPCGDITPTSGITGTPVIDVATGTLYAVTLLSSGSHVLFGLNILNGSVKSQVVVDPAGADPMVEQQRGALTLANGYVYVVYGGLDGDCGNYHGWVVGAPISGAGPLVAYQVPTHREGGIWGTAGTGSAANGSLYVATGNGDSATAFDFGDSVIELSPSLSPIGYFAPSNWAQLNSEDTDLGSVAPTVLPNGDVFQIGKAGVGYLLSGSDLGGIGGQITNTSICNGAYGATAHVGYSVFVPCLDGVFDVEASGSNLSVVWQTTSFDAGAPIVTDDVVWAVDTNSAKLLGFNISTGQQAYSFAIGSADHFISPAAGPTSVYVAGGDQLSAFALTA